MTGWRYELLALVNVFALEGGKHIGSDVWIVSDEYVPLAKSSSTSTSCSAAMLNKAVTLYRLVFLFVRRRDDMVAGDEGESGNDIVNCRAGDWVGGRCGLKGRKLS